MFVQQHEGIEARCQFLTGLELASSFPPRHLDKVARFKRLLQGDIKVQGPMFVVMCALASPHVRFVVCDPQYVDYLRPLNNTRVLKDLFEAFAPGCKVDVGHTYMQVALPGSRKVYLHLVNGGDKRESRRGMGGGMWVIAHPTALPDSFIYECVLPTIRNDSVINIHWPQPETFHAMAIINNDSDEEGPNIDAVEAQYHKATVQCQQAVIRAIPCRAQLLVEHPLYEKNVWRTIFACAWPSSFTIDKVKS